MSAHLRRLIPLFERERTAGRALVLATVVNTQGSTYTKPGAQMLIAKTGEYAGLLSGGCLEGDLSERAPAVFRPEVAQLARYDMRGPQDELFGLGSGCDGAMDILLQPLLPTLDWQPMKSIVDTFQAERSLVMLLIVKSPVGSAAPGSRLIWDRGNGSGEGTPYQRWCSAGSMPHVLEEYAGKISTRGPSRFVSDAVPGTDLLLLIQSPAPHILLLRAGPDARPVCELAHFLGWAVTVIDHRSHYAQRAHFPGATRVLDGGAEALAQVIGASREHTQAYSAAIVMSHSIRMDEEYVAELSSSDIPYVGLLGPRRRRERLLDLLGVRASSLRSRLRAPVGLNLGATTPEAIALAILAEVYTFAMSPERTV